MKSRFVMRSQFLFWSWQCVCFKQVDEISFLIQDEFIMERLCIKHVKREHIKAKSTIDDGVIMSLGHQVYVKKLLKPTDHLWQIRLYVTNVWSLSFLNNLTYIESRFNDKEFVTFNMTSTLRECVSSERKRYST